MTGQDDLSYPAICLARDDSVSIIWTPETLGVCNARAWYAHRYFEDLWIIDGDARLFRVQAALLVDEPRGWREVWTRLHNGPLKADLHLHPRPSASLDAAKDLVIEWLRRDPGFWETAQELEVWEGVIRSAPDVRAICAALG